MTRDGIVSIARAAGYSTADLNFVETLERFATLVAAAERERCAKMCEAYAVAGVGKEMADAIRRKELE